MQDAYTGVLLLYTIVMLQLAYTCSMHGLTIPILSWIFLNGTDAIIHTIAFAILVAQKWGKGLRARDVHRSYHYCLISVLYAWFTFGHIINYWREFDGEEPMQESLVNKNSITLKFCIYHSFLLAVSGGAMYRLIAAYQSL